MIKLNKFKTFILKWISQNKILTAILILAASLRFMGIYPGYPTTHPDETYIYGHAIKMIKNLNIDPTRYDYPAFIPLLHAILYMVIFNPLFIIYSLIFVPENLPNFKNILLFYQNAVLYNQQSAVIFWGRTVTAGFGVGIVYLSYLVGKNYFSKNVGLVTAFLVGVNFRQVLNSHISLPDIYNAFFLLLCFYFLKNLLDRPNRKNYLLSGLSLALFFCTKSQVFPLLTFGLVNFFIAWRETQPKGIFLFAKKFFKFEFILACLLISFLYVTINIYQFINWDKFYHSNHYTTLQYRFGINILDIYSISYLYHIGLGKLVFIFALLGMIRGLKRKYIFSSILLLSVVIPFLYLFLYYSNGGYYTRNFVTIIPILLIFAGLAIVCLSTVFVQRFKLNKKLLVVFIILVTFFISFDQFKNSIINSFYSAKSLSTTEAQYWIKKNVPQGSIVVARGTDKFDKKQQIKKITLEMETLISLAEMQEEGVEYGYVAIVELSNSFYNWMRSSTEEGIRFWNKKNADLISQNAFSAKVAKELASWSVAAFVKPWQAPDENTIIVKVPPRLEIGKKKLITKYSFDNQEEFTKWSLISGDDQIVKNIIFDPDTGHTQNGSLKINISSAYPSIVKATSFPIPIKKENDKSKAYEIVGWIKTGSVLDKKVRDGYISVNFYKEFPQKITLTSENLMTALSSRVYGTSSWDKKQVIVIAPSNAKFMTVSLEVYNPAVIDLWFDDIEIYESEDFYQDPRQKEPYLNYYQIPQNILFPVSHGNL